MEDTKVQMTMTKKRDWRGEPSYTDFHDEEKEGKRQNERVIRHLFIFFLFYWQAIDL